MNGIISYIMKTENKDFVPGPNCSSLGFCNRVGSCMEATVFEQELEYSSEEHRVEHHLSISKCQNPQASQARNKARKFLKK